MDPIKNLQDRTDAKLRYALIHLDELHKYSYIGRGNDFERAHQEAFLYQLLGALDAFLHELNNYCSCELEPHEISNKRLAGVLQQMGEECPELNEIIRLAQDNDSWLANAKEMRNHSTHRGNIGLKFFVGGPEDGQIQLKNPQTGKTQDLDYLDQFQSWWIAMSDLLKNLRDSATNRYNRANN